MATSMPAIAGSMGSMRARRLARLRRRPARRHPLPGATIALLVAIALAGFAGFGETSFGVAKIAFFVLLAGLAACFVYGLAGAQRSVPRL